MHQPIRYLPILLAVGLLACERQEPAPPTPKTAMELATGERVFKQVCHACHGTGAGGAPRLGDKGQWEQRLEQGHDTLYRHALEGFTGRHGVMPPRGGKAELTDAEVRSAVDYMVSRVS